MENPIVVAALVVGGVAFVFMIIGLGTTSWVTGPGFHAGLFVMCSDRLGGCFSFDAEGRTAAARAFIVLGFLCALAAAIIALVYYCKYVKNSLVNRTLSLVVGILFIVAGAVTLVGIILAVAGDSQPGVSLGYSFVLSLLGAILALVSGGLTMFHRSKVVVVTAA